MVELALVPAHQSNRWQSKMTRRFYDFIYWSVTQGDSTCQATFTRRGQIESVVKVASFYCSCFSSMKLSPCFLESFLFVVPFPFVKLNQNGHPKLGLAKRGFYVACVNIAYLNNDIISDRRCKIYILIVNRDANPASRLKIGGAWSCLGTAASPRDLWLHRMTERLRSGGVTCPTEKFI